MADADEGRRDDPEPRPADPAQPETDLSRLHPRDADAWKAALDGLFAAGWTAHARTDVIQRFVKGGPTEAGEGTAPAAMVPSVAGIYLTLRPPGGAGA